MVAYQRQMTYCCKAAYRQSVPWYNMCVNDNVKGYCHASLVTQNTLPLRKLGWSLTQGVRRHTFAHWHSPKPKRYVMLFPPEKGTKKEALVVWCVGAEYLRTNHWISEDFALTLRRMCSSCYFFIYFRLPVPHILQRRFKCIRSPFACRKLNFACNTNQLIVFEVIVLFCTHILILNSNRNTNRQPNVGRGQECICQNQRQQENMAGGTRDV